MTVRQLYTRQTVISVAALLIAGAILIFSARRASHLNERTAFTGTLIRLLGAQTVFSNEYVAYGHDRPLRQWTIASEEIHKTFAFIEKSGLTAEEANSLNTARWYYTRAEGMFERLRSAVGNPGTSPAIERRTELIVDELSEHLQSVIAHAYGLNAILLERVAFENRRDRFVMAAAFFVVLVVLLMNLVVLGRRLIGPLARLTVGTRALSRGDFGHVVPASSDDEIGELARSFNTMAGELSEMYGRLENELEDRRRAEEALREANEKLRLALESAEMGTWTWDIEKDEMLLDDRLAAALGRPSGSHLPGPVMLEVIHVDDRDRLLKELRAAASGLADLDTTVRLAEPVTPVRTFSVRGSVFTDPTSDPKAVSGVAWDITDKRLVEERLEASQRALQSAYGELESMVQDRTQALVRKTVELERSNADLEQFAYVASHDLQEPLRRIASYGDLLQDRYRVELDERGRRYATYMVEGVQRLQELIHALLDYSRLNRRDEVFAPVSMDQIFDHVLQDMDLAVREADAVIRRGDLPTIHGNALQINQLLQNLLSNAIKFRGKRRGEISVSAELRGPEWLVRVRDNGIGLSPEFREKIFVVFQRLHNHAEYPGTGIGLAICKKIVERHGGRIWVESVLGEGATFCFTLPAPPLPEPSVA